jgi:hypothetical protein
LVIRLFTAGSRFDISKIPGGGSDTVGREAKEIVQGKNLHVVGGSEEIPEFRRTFLKSG